jgi:quercetin dioxygenase-like cupin family protein
MPVGKPGDLSSKTSPFALECASLQEVSDPEVASRKILLEAGVGERTVDSVQVREIVLRPGQRIGAHVHSGPVVGYVVEGELVLQIEGQAPQSLLAGSAFHEPGSVAIVRFDNGSRTEPVKFVACFLLHGESPSQRML